MKTKEERSDGKEMMGVNKREGIAEGGVNWEQRMVRNCAKDTQEKKKKP